MNPLKVADKGAAGALFAMDRELLALAAGTGDERTAYMKPGVVRNGRVESPRDFERAILSVVSAIKGARNGVRLVVPDHEVIIRVIEGDEDPRVVEKKWGEYFTFERSEAWYSHFGRSGVRVAAAWTKETAETFQKPFLDAGIPLLGIEPASVAAARVFAATRDRGDLIGVWDDGSNFHITFVRDGMPHVFRGVRNREDLASELERTRRFIDMKYRAGMQNALPLLAVMDDPDSIGAERLDVECASPFLPCLGTLAASMTEMFPLDLRTPEFLAAQKKSKSIDPVKILRPIVIVMFAASIAGSGTQLGWRAWRQMEERATLSSAIATAKERNAAITKKLELAKKRKMGYDFVLESMKNEAPVLESLAALESSAPKGVRATGMKVVESRRGAESMFKTEFSIMGTDESELMQLAHGLNSCGVFSDVQIPATKNNKGNVDLRFEAKANDILTAAEAAGAFVIAQGIAKHEDGSIAAPREKKSGSAKGAFVGGGTIAGEAEEAERKRREEERKFIEKDPSSNVLLEPDGLLKQMDRDMKSKGKEGAR